MKNTNRFTNTALLLVTLFALLACTNMIEPPALTGTRAVVSVSVSGFQGRTVLPAVDIAGYRLFGGKTGAAEEQLAEFTSETTTLSLEPGTWNFTLNAYTASGELALQGKVQNQTLNTGGNQVVFDIEPLMSGKGGARITIHFPDYLGITKVTATGDLPEESTDIPDGEGTWIWEQNNINSGYYFVSFALYKGTERVSVVSETILVGTGLMSEKVIILSGNDLEPSLFTKAFGTTLTEKLNWLETNAQSGGNYLIEVSADESIAPRVLEYTRKSNISVTLIGLETVRTIDLSSNGSMFTVSPGVTLALGNNITLRGRADNNASLVSFKAINSSSGSLILDSGAVITGNTVPSYSGGGVHVRRYGTFTMNGGEITGNIGYSGGGVYVEYGTFTMNGGKITGNKADAGGGMTNNGTFTMNGGEITGNTASFMGGGVYGTFTMNGGKITGNTATSGGGVYMLGQTFTMNGGEITGNTAGSGGGVIVGAMYLDGEYTYATFTMNGGKITGNTASTYGGGMIVSGAFTKTGGIITGYADDPVNGNVVKDSSGVVQDNSGHAVCVVYLSGSTVTVSKRKETTAGTTTELSYDLNSGSPTWNGGWDF